MAKGLVIDVKKAPKEAKLRKGYAKQIFGLGVTSCADFLTLAYKKLKVPENKVSYVSGVTTVWPSRASLVIVDGIKQLAKFSDYIHNRQVIVVSDVPVLIRTLTFVDALDYDMVQSFAFNFKPVNIQAVRVALSRAGGEVEVRINNTNQLGYVIDSLKKTDALVSLFVATMASVDFTGRGRIYNAFADMCAAPKFVSTKFLASVEQARNEFNEAEVNAFVMQFNKSGKNYYDAIRSDLDAKAAGEEYDADPYGVSYFRKKIRSLGIANNRAKRAS